jgi:hypothetical protein
VLIGTLTAAVPSVIVVMFILNTITNIKTEKAQLQTDAYETAAARGYDLIKSEDPNLALLLALALLHPKEPDGDAIEALAYKALEFLGLKEFLHLKEVDDSAIERLPYKALEFLGLKKFLHLKEVDDSAIERLAYKALQTPRPKAVLSAPAAFPTATFSPDGQLLLISKGNAFQVWKANELELVKEFRPQGVYAGRRAVWSADGRWIIGATDDNRTALFAPCSVPVPALRKYFQQCVNKNEDEVLTIGERGTASWPSTLSPTGDRLLTGGSGQPPQLWDIGSNPAKSTFRFQDGPANFAIAFNQQGDRLALGSTDGSVQIHETADPTKGFTLQPQTRCDASGENPSVQVFSVAFNPGKDKGDQMVSTTLDGCLRLWNVKEQRLIENHSLNNTGFFFRKLRSQRPKDCHDLRRRLGSNLGTWPS